jgi:drug/metabolite transporter (DMT)-like permease
MNRTRILGYGALALLILIWGTTWAAIRLGLEGIPPFSGVSIRFLIAGAALLALARMLRVPSQRGARLYRLWLVETVFGFCISYGVVYWAEQWIPSGLASVLFSTFPFFVAVLAHFWLENEPLRLRQLVGIAVGSAGVATIFSDDLALAGEQSLIAAIVFLGSPVAAAVSHVLVKKWGRGMHPLNLVGVPMVATGSCMGLLALFVEADRSFTFDAVAVGAIFYLALPGSAVTFTLYYWLLERMPATRLSFITYGIPVVAVAAGALLFAEPITVKTVTGAALVLAGVGLALRG